MYVRDSENVENIDKFYCNEDISEYLQENGCPLFGKEGECFVFVRTDKLEALIKEYSRNAYKSRRGG